MYNVVRGFLGAARQATGKSRLTCGLFFSHRTGPAAMNATTNRLGLLEVLLVLSFFASGALTVVFPGTAAPICFVTALGFLAVVQELRRVRSLLRAQQQNNRD